MDREQVEGWLKLAEQHVTDAADIVARQQKRVARLASNRHDTTDALELLQRFEDSYAAFVKDRDRLLDLLGLTR